MIVHCCQWLCFIHFCYYSVSLYTQHKPNDEAVHVRVCTSNLKMTSADNLECAEVTVHSPNANGEPPTTVVPTEPIHVGSGYPAKVYAT